jgi:hypothetical protein
MSLFLYQNPSATDQVIDRDGWLNTGDIGWIVPYHSIGRSRNSGGVIVVEGRAKDTIVLSSGTIEVCNFEARLYACIMCAFCFFNPLGPFDGHDKKTGYDKCIISYSYLPFGTPIRYDKLILFLIISY